MTDKERKEKIKSDYALLNNQKLVEKTIEAVFPDDYDSDFTKWGKIEREIALQEFSKRLIEAKFIDTPIT